MKRIVIVMYKIIGMLLLGMSIVIDKCSPGSRLKALIFTAGVLFIILAIKKEHLLEEL